MKGKNKWLWISRICIFVSMLAIVITSQLYIADYVDFSVARQIGRSWAIFVTFGAPVVFIAVFTWFYPAAGGVITVLYVMRTLPMELVAGMPQILVPIPLHILIYGVLALGGLISVVYYYTAEKPEKEQNPFALRLIRWARVAVFLNVVLCTIMMFAYGAIAFFIVAFISLILLAIAWRWPASGGFLLIIAAVYGLYAVYDYYGFFGSTRLAYLPLAVLVIGGFLHVVAAWKQGLLRYG